MTLTLAPTADNCIAPTESLEFIKVQLNQIRNTVADLLKQRENLLLTTQAELIAAGIQAHVITRSARHNNYEVGELGFVVESFQIFSPTYTDHSVSFYRAQGMRSTLRAWGPRAHDTGLYIDHGVFEVILCDEDSVLVAKPDQDDDEDLYRRAVARLRTLARNEAMRVRTCDRQIEIVNPFNTVMHTGDVVSAFKWLMGIEEAKNLNTATREGAIA